MPIRSTAIRLFVSSTFSDFRLEREILDARVFPEIQRYCFERGFEFQPVDLRWGIGDDIATLQSTLRVCLNEVNECVQTNLRPYFLILVGDRYGWRPLPEFIPKDEFELLVGWISRDLEASGARAATVRLLRRWYRLDLNHVPPHYVLQPRKGKSREDRHWKILEQKMRVALAAAAARCKLSADASQKYSLSATAQEIHRGVIAASAKARIDFDKHVLCFHRKRLGMPPHASLSPDELYGDIGAKGEPDQDAAVQLRALTGTLRSMLGNHMLEYHVFPGHEDSLRTYTATFEADAKRLLMSLVAAELPVQEQYRSQQFEWLHHTEFGSERQRNLLGRDDLIQRVDDFIGASGGRGLILHGRGGMGKSTLLAKAASMAGDAATDPAKRGMVTLQRYVGATSESSTPRGLILSLLRELGAALSTGWTDHTNLTALGGELRRMLTNAAAASAQGVLVAIDGLDQLTMDATELNLEWLPWPPPDGLALIVSVLDGPLLTTVKSRMVGAHAIEVGNLARKPGRRVLRSLLRERDRTLQRSQEAYVLERFASEGSPLYLRIAAEVARHWPAYRDAKPQSGILPTSTIELIAVFFASMHVDRGHDKVLVAKVLGLLMASKSGLNERELLALLWQDNDVQTMVRNKQGSSVPLAGLPMIYWSRLRDDLRSFLVLRAGDGTILLGFFHRLFDEAARAAFLSNADARSSMRSAIALHFASEAIFLADPVSGKSPLVNLRKIVELPYQLHLLGDAGRLFALVASWDYFRAKLMAGLSDEFYLETQQCARLLRTDVDSAARARLSSVLVSHVVSALKENDPSLAFSTLDLHNGLAYRDNGSFYGAFLKRCIAALQTHPSAKTPRFRNAAIELAARLGNSRRRKGMLDSAQRELTELVPRLRRLKLWSLASTAEYELGYVAFMRGHLAEAANLFDLSARTAGLSGHVVSEWMSRCVAANVRWIDAVSRHEHAAEGPRFVSVLDKAEGVFLSNLSTDGNALRWVYNVRHHRLKVAFRLGDVTTAAALVQQIREDPWSRQYDQISTDSIIVSSRLAMLEGRLLEGAGVLYAYANSLSETSEARAEDYFDAGMGFWVGGDRARASRAWMRGSKLVPSHGNAPWQRLIAEARAMA